MSTVQACTSLGEVQMGDWDGVRQPAISARLPLVLESDLGLLRRRLPFLHHVEFGGQVGPVLLQVLSCGRVCMAGGVFAQKKAVAKASLSAGHGTLWFMLVVVGQAAMQENFQYCRGICMPRPQPTCHLAWQ